MCRLLALENDDTPECDTCNQAREPAGASSLNYKAINIWQNLDIFGRDIDTFAGLPRPLRLDVIELECKRQTDPDGVRWRLLILEEKIWGKRIREWEGKRKK